MRLALYAVTLGILLTILLLREPATSALSPQGGGLIFGSVYGFTWDDQLIPLEWVQVTATNPNYPPFTVSTGANGTFEMFVPTGTYNMTVSPPGYKAHSSMVSVSDGSSSSASFYLEQSHVPIPEFPTQGVALIIAVALATTLLTRKNAKNKR
jgi:hypothetical protein